MEAGAREGRLKRFAFRLERLLELRTRAQRRAEQALAQSHRLSEQHQVQRARIRADMAATCAWGAREGAGPPDAPSLLSCARRLELLRRREARQSQRVAEARRQENCRREELLSAVQARRGLARLKQHRHAAHMAEAVRAEDALLDEAATSQFTRRGPGRLVGSS